MDSDVKAGQFIVVNGSRQFLGQVTRPSTFNPAFSDPRLIQFHENGGPDVQALYPEQEWTIAQALIVGEIEADRLDITGSHPKPGDMVSLADNETLTKVFNMGNHIILGQVYGHEGVRLQFDKDVLSYHTLITGMTSSGKTYAGAVLIEDAIEAGLPVVVIDPHGEFGPLIEPNNVKPEIDKLSLLGLSPRGYETQEFGPPDYASGSIKPFTITAGELSFSDIMAIVPLPGDIQQMILLKSMENLRARHGSNYDLAQLKNEIERYGKEIKQEKSAETTSLRLQSLQNYGLLGKGMRAEDIVKPETVTILTLPGVDDYMQQIVVAILARKLLGTRQTGQIPPLFLYVEEAYLYAPSSEDPPSKSALIRLVEQGRKFGIGVGISTQQPSNVTSKIIAQCHLKIVLRLDTSSDLNYIVPWLGPETSYYTDMLPSFPDGRAIVKSKGLRRPVIVDIRARKSKHGGRTGMVTRSKTAPTTNMSTNEQSNKDESHMDKSWWEG